MEVDEQAKRHSVLLVSGSDKAAEAIRAALPPARFAPVDLCARAAEARERLLQQDYAIVVINAPLPDACGPELADALAHGSRRGVLLLAAADDYAGACAALEDAGVLTLAKPGTSQMLVQGLNLLVAMRTRLCALEKKTLTLEMKMEDIRIVNRAKWVLIEQLKMDETAAHHYIEKQAMNQRRSRREIAQSILMTYEAY